jgi:hypothetical protein
VIHYDITIYEFHKLLASATYCVELVIKNSFASGCLDKIRILRDRLARLYRPEMRYSVLVVFYRAVSNILAAQSQDGRISLNKLIPTPSQISHLLRPSFFLIGHYVFHNI